MERAATVVVFGVGQVGSGGVGGKLAGEGGGVECAVAVVIFGVGQVLDGGAGR